MHIQYSICVVMLFMYLISFWIHSLIFFLLLPHIMHYILLTIYEILNTVSEWVSEFKHSELLYKNKYLFSKPTVPPRTQFSCSCTHSDALWSSVGWLASDWLREVTDGCCLCWCGAGGRGGGPAWLGSWSIGRGEAEVLVELVTEFCFTQSAGGLCVCSRLDWVKWDSLQDDLVLWTPSNLHLSPSSFI